MKNKVSNALKNKNKSEEHKLKLKEAKGKEDKQYRSFINGNNRRGKKHSKETIEKIIKNSKNIKHPYGFKCAVRSDIGHFTRSSWEANYVRILKYLNIKYEYESEIIWLKDKDSNISYTPDFKINDIYIEIKGYWYDDAIHKVKLFRDQYPNKKLIIIDSNKYKKLENHYKNILSNWE